MKHILSTIQKFFYISDDMVITPRRSTLTMWTVWIIAVIALFDIVFADEILSLRSRVAPFIACGMLILIMAFHDQEYVKLKLKKRCNNLLGYLYCINLVLMGIQILLEVVSYWGEIGFPFFVRQSVFLIFWILSIPLVLIYEAWKWCICAGAVFLTAIGYHALLQWYINNWNTNTFFFLCLTIGGVLCAAIVSFNISRYKIKKLQDKQTAI